MATFPSSTKKTLSELDPLTKKHSGFAHVVNAGDDTRNGFDRLLCYKDTFTAGVSYSQFVVIVLNILY